MAKNKNRPEHYLLLVWEMLPEEVRLYLIPQSEISDVQRSTLVTACGKVVNYDDLSDEETTALERINNALCKEERHISKEYDHPEFHANWAKYQVDGNEPIDKIVACVIRCGFQL